MTARKRFVLDKAWQALYDICEIHERMVSAGEFARFIGITRNTAHNWLTDMLQTQAISVSMRTYGNVAVCRYGVDGFTFDGKE